jgi:hypothetical protein
MLYAIDGDKIKKITYILHKDAYYALQSRLSSIEIEAIEEELNKKISGNEVNTSTFLPGHNWSGTVFEPIYTKACKKNREVSAKFFGVMLWVVLLKRKDNWAFERYKMDGRDIRGMTYFKINNPKGF